MKGSFAFDLLLGVLAFLFGAALLTPATNIMDREVQRSVGYLLCETVASSLSRYYSLLAQSGFAPPTEVNLSYPLLDITGTISGGWLDTRIHFINSEMDCRRRRLSQ